MSGTSLDGVDAALVDFGGGTLHCVGTHYLEFPTPLRAEILALHEAGTNELQRAALLANTLAEHYGTAVRTLLARTHTPSNDVLAIGCHGQTVRHAPQDGYTLQINNPALLAELSGIRVVADFRSRDVAAGGQGAPLVPAFHDDVFRHPEHHRVIANIGGIANLTDLAPGRTVRGFDCGPGNMLLDAWAQRHLGKPMDENGRWAASGRLIPELLQRMLAHPFIAAAPPKSCGREQFNLAWLDGCLTGDEEAADVQASLATLTALSLSSALRTWCGPADELFVCGGGAHNQTLLAALTAALPGTRIGLTDELGLPADWVEAVAFAWLARQTLDGRPGNLPEVTGARGPRILGAIYPA